MSIRYKHPEFPELTSEQFIELEIATRKMCGIPPIDESTVLAYLQTFGANGTEKTR